MSGTITNGRYLLLNDADAGISDVIDYLRGINQGVSDDTTYRIVKTGTGYSIELIPAVDLATYDWLNAPTGVPGSTVYVFYDISKIGTPSPPPTSGEVIVTDNNPGSVPGGGGGATDGANLVVNYLTLGKTAVRAGETATISFGIGNAGSLAAKSSTARVYFSTDETISAADALVGSFAVPALAAGGQAEVRLATVIAPDTVAGTYYVGVIADAVAGETSTTDNGFGVSLAVGELAGTRPNLVINYLTAASRAVLSGGSTAIEFGVGNAGDGAAAASTARLYLSQDETITAADTLLGRFDIAALAQGGAASVSTRADIPANTAPGSYYIGVIADAVPGEVTVTDNGYAQAFTVAGTVTPSPNLVVNYLTLGAASAALGGFSAIRFAIGNAGAAAAAATTARLYLSSDDIITSADTLIGAVGIGALAAGQEAAGRMTASIPLGIAPGNYHIGVVAEAVADETSTTDNAYAQPVAITSALFAPRISIAALDADKQDARLGSVAFTFEVTRSGDVSGVSTVGYTVVGAASGSVDVGDFVGGRLPVGTVSFLAGETGKVISIDVAGGLIPEGHEQFTVRLAAISPDVVLEVASAAASIRADEPIVDLSVADGRTGLRWPAVPAYYNGPVAGLEKEFIGITPDNLNVTASGDNWFLRSGAGTDALAVHGGRNVLDGGTGSNFLTGGVGEDTFFLDARGAADAIWSTVVDFGANDSVTVWGITAQDFDIVWLDGLGAAGYTGLTMQATAPDKPGAKLTMAGFSQSDMETGRLRFTLGMLDAATPYLYIQGALPGA